MAKLKLTKSAVDAAQPQAQAVELRDTVVPGFMCKITPAGRKVFMLQYRTNAGERRKPALGLYGELTVEQARALAQEWMAEVRRGGDPSAAKAAARSAPTVKELCGKFMEDYSKQRNKPSTQEGYQSVIDRNIIPILGRIKVQDVKRSDVAAALKKMAHKPADANRTFSVMRRMFNLAEVWGFFQFLDGAGQGRLVNVQALCGAGEVEFFGYGEKASKVSKLHCLASTLFAPTSFYLLCSNGSMASATPWAEAGF